MSMAPLSRYLIEATTRLETEMDEAANFQRDPHHYRVVENPHKRSKRWEVQHGEEVGDTFEGNMLISEHDTQEEADAALTHGLGVGR